MLYGEIGIVAQNFRSRFDWISEPSSLTGH